MKPLIICLFFLTGSLAGYSQLRGNASTSRPNADTSKILDIREKLVQLAMQNPDYEVSDRLVNKSYYELKKAKGSWLGAIAVQGNVNEFSITPNNTGAVNLYPRYNVGVNIPFDIFTEKSNNVKIARETYMIAEAERNKRARAIRAEVLSRYEDFLMYKTQLDLQLRITQDEYTTYVTKEKDFQDNFIDKKEYDLYVKSYNEQLGKKAEVQRNYNIAKLRLEELIGVPIEQVAVTK